MKYLPTILLASLLAAASQGLRTNECSRLFCNQNLLPTPPECQKQTFEEWAACICPLSLWQRVITLCIQKCPLEDRGFVQFCPGGLEPPVSYTSEPTPEPQTTIISTTISVVLTTTESTPPSTTTLIVSNSTEKTTPTSEPSSPLPKPAPPTPAPTSPAPEPSPLVTEPTPPASAGQKPPITSETPTTESTFIYTPLRAITFTDLGITTRSRGPNTVPTLPTFNATSSISISTEYSASNTSTSTSGACTRFEGFGIGFMVAAAAVGSWLF